MEKVKLRELTEEDVQFTVTIEPEDVPVRGHFDTGEDRLDKEMEDEILRRVRKGDDWAWCTVTVTASWKARSASNDLGCCSYESEEDFTGEEDGYYSDMKAEALSQLNADIAAAFEDLRELLPA